MASVANELLGTQLGGGPLFIHEIVSLYRGVDLGKFAGGRQLGGGRVDGRHRLRDRVFVVLVSCAVHHRWTVFCRLREVMDISLCGF